MTYLRIWIVVQLVLLAACGGGDDDGSSHSGSGGSSTQDVGAAGSGGSGGGPGSTGSGGHVATSGSGGAHAGSGGAQGGGGSGGSSSMLPIDTPGKVSATGPTTLVFRGETSICHIDDNQDLSCQNLGASDQSVYGKGPLTSAGLQADTQIDYGCGLRPDGSITCWNTSDPNGRLCQPDGGVICRGDGVPPSGKFIAVAVGAGFACAIGEAGGITCWGAKLGESTTAPSGTDFVAIDSEGVLSCALTKTGDVKCWGDTSWMDDAEPLREPAKQIMVGDAQRCALLQSGKVQCAGFFDSSVHIDPNLTFERISLRGTGLCGLTAAGEAHCAGSAYVERVPPLPGPYTQVASTTYNACGLRDDGSVECWGHDWGNGAGPETCVVTEAQLTANGHTHMLHAGQWSWAPNLAPEAAQASGDFRYFTTFTTGEGDQVNDTPLAMFGGTTNLLPVAVSGETGPRELLPKGTAIELSESVWALDADATGLEELLCTGPDSGSTVTHNGDELVFDLVKVASLGKCPGAPVDGELTVCIDNCSGPAAPATLHGTPWTAQFSGYAIGGNSRLDFDDGSRVQFEQAQEGVSGPWGLLLTALDGPFGGEVFCIGNVSGGFGADTTTLSSLSTLGKCPSTGTGTLSGCSR